MEKKLCSRFTAFQQCITLWVVNVHMAEMGQNNDFSKKVAKNTHFGGNNPGKTDFRGGSGPKF